MSCIDIFHYDYCFNNCIIYMIMKEERQIGEIFEYNGVKLKVRKRATFEECCDCYFNHKSRYLECSKAICLFLHRSDKQNVLFEEIKEE